MVYVKEFVFVLNALELGKEWVIAYISVWDQINRLLPRNEIRFNRCIRIFFGDSSFYREKPCPY